jgi:hypothetical protein
MEVVNDTDYRSGLAPSSLKPIGRPAPPVWIIQKRLTVIKIDQQCGYIELCILALGSSLHLDARRGAVEHMFRLAIARHQPS